MRRVIIKKIAAILSLGVGALAIALAIGYFTPRKWGNISRHDCEIEIYVAKTGIHADVIVPVRHPIWNWQQYLSLAEIGRDAKENYNYLSFGWGDRDFYMQTPTLADANPTLAARALFMPTPATMQVRGYREIPQNVEVKCAEISRADYLKLQQFIRASFEVGESGEPMRLGKGYDKSSGFYAATGDYSILRHCNTWLADGLRLADVNTPLWAWSPSAILFHFESGCQCEF